MQSWQGCQYPLKNKRKKEKIVWGDIYIYLFFFHSSEEKENFKNISESIILAALQSTLEFTAKGLSLW